MTVTINGSTGIAGVDGSAGTPSVQGADTNTGMFFPAADTVGVSTGGTERMRIDSSGNVGIGTSSPNTKTQIYKAANSSFTGTSLGALAITDSSATVNYYSSIDFNTNANNALPLARIGMQYTGGGSYLMFGTSNNYASGITSTAMAIDPSGNTLLGATSRFSGFTAVNRLYLETSTGDFFAHFRSTASSPYGLALTYSTAPNNSGNSLIDARDSSAQRFAVYSNGGIANYQANNSNLSDARLKKDIQLSGSYLDKICAIPVKTFLYNDQTDNELNLGVIAQEVEAVAPELVDKDGWADKAPDGSNYLSIYQTDLQYALMKCIQELKAQNDELKARLEALEAK
jgi:hypothetical protein